MATSFYGWDVKLVYALMAALFVMEMIGVFNPRFITITFFVRAHTRLWIRWMILGWMIYHFGIPTKAELLAILSGS